MEKKKKHGGRTLLIALLCVIVLLAGAGYFAMDYVLGRINRVDPSQFEYVQPEDETFETDEQDAGYDERDAESVVWNDVQQMQSEEVINILLIGQDRREGETRARSDSMIVVSINEQRNVITLVSIMRDLYVQIPGYSDNRINSAYTWGGMELLNQTITQNFGIEIDGTIEVDFTQFQEIVDILGGVDVEMSKNEALYMEYTMNSGDMSEGINHLNGKQALDFATMRGLDDDFSRTRRQRHLMTQVAASLKSASASQLLDLVNQVLPHVSTDMSNAQILGYASSAVQVYLAGNDIVTGRIPQSGGYETARIREMDVLVPDLQACQEYLEQLIYGQEQLVVE